MIFNSVKFSPNDSTPSKGRPTNYSSNSFILSSQSVQLAAAPFWPPNLPRIQLNVSRIGVNIVGQKFGVFSRLLIKIFVDSFLLILSGKIPELGNSFSIWLVIVPPCCCFVRFFPLFKVLEGIALYITRWCLFYNQKSKRNPFKRIMICPNFT